MESDNSPIARYYIINYCMIYVRARSLSFGKTLWSAARKRTNYNIKMWLRDAFGEGEL